MIQKRQKRNVRLAHLRTTIVLEPYIWECISDILQRESIDLDSFCQEIDKRRQFFQPCVINADRHAVLFQTFGGIILK